MVPFSNETEKVPLPKCQQKGFRIAHSYWLRKQPNIDVENKLFEYKPSSISLTMIYLHINQKIWPEVLVQFVSLRAFYPSRK
jgi:hypothetical protein